MNNKIIINNLIQTKAIINSLNIENKSTNYLTTTIRHWKLMLNGIKNKYNSIKIKWIKWW